MPNLNKVFLMGNLTRDPQLSYLPSQTAVCELSLAINRRWRDQSGQDKEEVTFVECSMFGKRAEVLSKYLKKGSSLHVEGRLKLDQWEAQDGTKRSKMRVIIENFELLPQRHQDAEQGEQQPPARPARNPAARSARPSPEPAPEPDAAADYDAPPAIPVDEDIPF